MTTPHAQITWADGTVTNEPLVSGGGNAWTLQLRNPGNPDNWGNAWTPQPKFFSEVKIIGLPAGYGNILGNIQDTKTNADGSLTVVDPTSYKYQHTRYGLLSHPAYTQCANFHCIDGGDTLYFRFVPQDDILENALLMQVTLPQLQKAFELLNYDETRISSWPLLQKILSLYTVDDTTFSNVNLNGGTLESWLLIPEHFASRWSAGGIGPLASLKHWYGFGTHAASEGFSNEHYGHDAWFIGQGLRMVAANPGNLQILEKAKTAITTGLYLLRYKIAYGLIDTDGTMWHAKRWRNEKGETAGFRGTAGIQPSPAKEWDLGLCLGYTLCPSDPLISRAFQVRSQMHQSVGPQWSGSGGARNLGRHLSNLLDFYKATGNQIYKTKAEAEITHAFSATVNGITNLWFRESTIDQPSCSEGMMALTNVMRWVFDHGVRPDLQQHLKNMLQWYLSYGGVWNGPTKWKACYYGTGATNAGMTLTSANFNSETGGCFWLGLKKYAEPSQLQQFAAIENQVYSAWNPTTFDADYGGLGPSHEKWVPMMAESARI